jgi:hypothetical protein
MPCLLMLMVVCDVCLFQGAHGVGRRHIKNTLITSFADRYAYPIPRKLDFRITVLLTSDVLYIAPVIHRHDRLTVRYDRRRPFELSADCPISRFTPGGHENGQSADC